MTIEHYEYNQGENSFEFKFYSHGPNGRIKKIVQFLKKDTSAGVFYNLGFGDWNEAEQCVDHFVTSNNDDAEKILATIASLIVLFTDKYPDAIIYAEGSTPSRTRLYQMSINKYWKEIQTLFIVFGFIKDQGFAPFEKGVNYEAFVVHRKI